MTQATPLRNLPSGANYTSSQGTLHTCTFTTSCRPSTVFNALHTLSFNPHNNLRQQVLIELRGTFAQGHLTASDTVRTETQGCLPLYSYSGPWCGVHLPNHCHLHILIRSFRHAGAVSECGCCLAHSLLLEGLLNFTLKFWLEI